MINKISIHSPYGVDPFEIDTRTQHEQDLEEARNFFWKDDI